jgi:hypothetical protein
VEGLDILELAGGAPMTRFELPCRHIFHLNTEQTVLTAEKWKEYLKLFEHGGMEVYETIGIVLVPRDEERGSESAKPARFAGNARAEISTTSCRP